MTKIIGIYDHNTGEQNVREMNSEELAEAKRIEAEAEARLEAQAKAEADKAALLAKLGITADEAKLLLS